MYCIAMISRIARSIHCPGCCFSIKG